MLKAAPSSGGAPVGVASRYETAKPRAEQYDGAVTTAKAFTLVGKRVTPTLFDTGASPSVLRWSAWQEMDAMCGGLPWRAPPPDYHLAMPNGTAIYLLGLTTLPVTVVGQTHEVEVSVVKRLPIDLLLGLPAMCAMGAVIDTADMCIRLKAVPHRALKIRLAGETPQEVHTVKAETVVPPASQSVVSVVTRPLGDHDTFDEDEWKAIAPYETTERFKKLLVARGVGKGKITNVLVANLTNKEVRLTPGTRIARSQPLEDKETMAALEQRDSGLYDDVEAMDPPRLTRERSVAPLEEIWEELRMADNVTLDELQKQKVRALVKEYQALWSTDRMPLTTTEAASHVIDTARARPVAQHPRPTGPAQKAEIQRQIEDMLRDSIIAPSQSPWASPVVLRYGKNVRWSERAAVVKPRLTAQSRGDLST